MKALTTAGLTKLIELIKSSLANKQATLISGTNIKTINNQNILGSGNITIQGGGSSAVDDVKVNGTSVVQDKVANVSVPTKTSDITNDSGFITNSALSGYATETYVNNHHDSTKQDTISDLTTIRTNATAGKSANDTIATYGNIVTHNSNEYATASQGAKADSALQQSDIINDVTSSTTNKALSANMGKQLQDQITALTGRGTYLSIWNCTTGLAMTTPTIIPRVYKTGDWFLVGYVGTTNYKPTGTSYDPSVPSTVVETNPIKVNDAYYYDGTTWTLLDTPQVDVAFSTLAGSPYDNTNLSNALNDKADSDDIPTKTSDLTNDSDYITSSYHDSTKQNTTDNNLETTDKTIVGAINEINSKPSVTSLSALTDVTLTTPADGEVLKYDEATEKWINGEGGSKGWTPSILQAYWSDCLLNRQDMLRADTFSWQSGAVYTSAYQHLVDDIDSLDTLEYITIGDDTHYHRNPSADTGGRYAWAASDTYFTDTATPEESDAIYFDDGDLAGMVMSHGYDVPARKTETIGGYTITYYLANDGHKICPASEESNIISIYSATGIAWYYILDTTNQRFKLPRNNSVEIHGLLIDSGEQNGVSYRVYQDGYCEQWGKRSKTAGTTISLVKTFADTNFNAIISNAELNSSSGVQWRYLTFSVTVNTIELTNAGSNDFATYWRACGYLATGQYSNAIENNYKSYHKYLYFYVGQFSQTATEQTAGLNAELFNGKVDVDSLVEVNPMIISYVSGTSGYNIWANGYCEMWGKHLQTSTATSVAITLLKTMKDTNYSITSHFIGPSTGNKYALMTVYNNPTVTGFTVYDANLNAVNTGFYWRVCGYLAEGQF